MSIQLVPGWAMSASLFSPLRTALRRPSRALDLPGFGSRLNETCPARLAALADSLHGPAEPTVYLGWSLGGLACLQLALQRPERVKALIILCSTPRFLADPQWPAGATLENFSRFRDAFQQDWQQAVRRFLLMQTGKNAGNSAAVRRLVEDLAGNLPKPEDHNLDNGLEVLAHADLRDSLAQLDVPVLLIGGQRDRVCHPDATEFMANNIPGSRLHTLNSGHLPHLSHTHELAALVDDFLDDCLHGGRA